MTNKYKWKTIIGVIGVWLHNHPNQKKHNIEFHTDELEYIKKALTPPTADEVCKALSEWYTSYEVNYDENELAFYFITDGRRNDISDIDSLCMLSINSLLPPHLITLIGRFYEGLENENTSK